VIATVPEATVASPLTCPRCPLGMVRPSTSLEAIDDNERASAKTASAPTMPQPATAPVVVAARTAMATTVMAWPTAPATQTHLRTGRLRTQGTRAAWGSIEPDSRTGTSIAAAAAGAPTVASSQASTVFGSTIRSPAFCRAIAPTCLTVLPGTSSSTRSGSSPRPWSSSASTRAAWSRSTRVRAMSFPVRSATSGRSRVAAASGLRGAHPGRTVGRAQPATTI
jgi:hypothetical protein